MGKAMRVPILGGMAIMTAVGVLTAVDPTLAAPMCETTAGVPVVCGHPGAMPLGWTVSPQQRAIYLKTLPPDPSPTVLISLAALIGAFFALIALMPDFQGDSGSSWDRQEEDDP